MPSGYPKTILKLGTLSGIISTMRTIKDNSGDQMANAEKVLYRAGNPNVAYAAIPAESTYTELDRENSRLIYARAELRGELNEAREALKSARFRVLCLGVVVGLYTAGGLITIGILLLR